MKYMILILYNMMLIYHHQSELLLMFLSLSSFLMGLGMLASEPILSYEKDQPMQNKFKKFLISVSMMHTVLFMMNLMYPY